MRPRSLNKHLKLCLNLLSMLFHRLLQFCWTDTHLASADFGPRPWRISGVISIPRANFPPILEAAAMVIEKTDDRDLASASLSESERLSKGSGCFWRLPFVISKFDAPPRSLPPASLFTTLPKVLLLIAKEGNISCWGSSIETEHFLHENKGS